MKKVITLLACNFLLLAGISAQEYGLASFYSDKFHGKPTASGELYDMNKYTCAHKTHPYGSVLKVTRLDNKKSVTVRVNDRGPYISGRVVDLSRKAAQRLDLVGEGTARVKVEVVERMDPSTSVAETTEKPKTTTSSTRPSNSSSSNKSTATKSETSTTKAKSSTTTTASNNSSSKKTAEKKTASNQKKTVANKTTAAKPSSTGTSAKPAGALVTANDYQKFDLYQIELRRPTKKGFGVQVASLTDYENVLKEVANLQGAVYYSSILLSVEPNWDGSPIYKIVLGPFDDREAAEKYKKNLKRKMGKEGFVVDLEAKEY
jgi:rare lipoprotein A